MHKPYEVTIQTTNDKDEKVQRTLGISARNPTNAKTQVIRRVLGCLVLRVRQGRYAA